MNASLDGAILAPLLPLASSFTWLDILLPPLLLLVSLKLYDVTRSSNDKPARTKAHVLKCKTAHARFLPRPSTHQFSYTITYLGLDLDALESGELDLEPRLFRWGEKTGFALTKLKPSGYLRSLQDSRADAEQGIKARLLDELATHDVVTSELEVIYMVTMPSFLALDDINPLTTYYCYRRSCDPAKPEELAVVVLEVHNTFGERHLYVLRIGVEEDVQISRGYEHQWTFPRAFFVSPFNDRSGYYRCSVRDPLACRNSISLATALPDEADYDIRLVLLTADKQKKLYASLKGQGLPLTVSSLSRAIISAPLDLLLTTPRISWQAAKLHFSKKLYVYPRPEPHAEAVDRQITGAQEGGKAANVFWQSATSLDLMARDCIIESVKRLDLAPPVELALQLADPDVKPNYACTSPRDGQAVVQTKINCHSPLAFIDILFALNAEAAVLVGSQAERRWDCNNIGAFSSLFRSQPTGFMAGCVSALRRQQAHWYQSFLSTEERATLQDRHPCLFDAQDYGIQMHKWQAFRACYIMAISMFFERLGYWSFRLARARFVPGTEPWRPLNRLIRREDEQIAAEPKRHAPGCDTIALVLGIPAARSRMVSLTSRSSPAHRVAAGVAVLVFIGLVAIPLEAPYKRYRHSALRASRRHQRLLPSTGIRSPHLRDGISRTDYCAQPAARHSNISFGLFESPSVCNLQTVNLDRKTIQCAGPCAEFAQDSWQPAEIVYTSDRDPGVVFASRLTNEDMRDYSIASASPPSHLQKVIVQARSDDEDDEERFYDFAFDRHLTSAQCDEFFPGLFHEADRAASWWNARGGIHRSQIDRGTVASHARILIKRNRLYIKHFRPVTTTRVEAAIALIHEAILSSVEPIPDVELLLHLDDTGNSKPGVPMLVLGRRPSEELLWLMPDFGFYGWPEAIRVGSYIHDYDQTLESETHASWKHKKPTAFWRGASLGLRDRQSLVNNSRPYGWADIAIVDWLKGPKGILNPKQTCAHRYLIHTEGLKAYSGRLKYLLLCRSVSIMRKLDFIQHFHPLLDSSPGSPSQNVIEIEGSDWTALPDRMQMLIADDRTTEEIAHRSYTLFRRYLSPAANDCYWRRVFQRWSEAQRFVPKLTSGSVPYESFDLMKNVTWLPS
ncbi:hypothetical protein E5Q_04658 [Mixia osmundae IAM 14324]|uniref:Glycosyl transferase CAP10 domain-containing protein n=1 Tax=Mixia osmundae (strain CBS 9802 / IAM 14324 / JCM 22182 / KY 12970) TaxID=764103 RepID=G7E568_MIXOS|nr:hypothetical protein E5Q_04658 [Mixia osmundae IAM 14324]